MAYPHSDMNIWLLFLGVAGILGAGLWYVSLLRRWTDSLPWPERIAPGRWNASASGSVANYALAPNGWREIRRHAG